jgi:sec-independent protein translocase protein TatA
MSIGIWQLVLILAIVFVIFGAGKLPRVMGDLGKGVRAMRDGLKGEGDKDDPKHLTQDAPSTTIEGQKERDHRQ